MAASTAVVAVVVAVLAALPAAGAQLRISDASGALSTDRSGAIFSADGMAPGQTASGEISVDNSGDAEAQLSLATTKIVDTSGPAGGVLSSVLTLRVEELSADGTWSARYDGGLRGLETLDLGTIQGKSERHFRFVVAFPDGGVPATPTSGDNALQASGVSVDYAWSITGEDAPAPAPAATPDGTPTPTPTPDLLAGLTPAASGTPVTGSSTTAGTLTSGAKSGRCLSRRRFTIRLNLPKSTRLSTLRVTVGKRRAKIERGFMQTRAIIDLRGFTARKVTVRVRARTTHHRTLRQSRTYTLCVSAPTNWGAQQR